jgi:hypothetical protein
MAHFQLGSISHGTLRTEDLLPAFAYKMGELTHNPISNTSKYPNEAMANLWDEAIKAINNPDTDTNPLSDDECVGRNEILSDLQDALNELCPPFVYFGTLEGDGADFGFWVDRDGLDEALTQHDVPDPDRDGCQVLEDDGVIVQVSDHGNVTVMDLERNVIWSVV